MSILSVVVPLLNEEEIIPELMNKLTKSLSKITADYEIILVDDGSFDSSWNLIEKAADKDVRIKGIKFSKNFGHHNAITAGLKEVDSDYAVVMDGDLQDNPEAIVELYNKVQEGFDIVYVSRKKRPENKIYLILQRIYYKSLMYLTGIKFDYSQANYSIITRKVVDAFNLFPEQTRFYVSTLKLLGFKTSSINSNHGRRVAGTPSYSISRRFKLAFDIIIAYSDRPLYFLVYLGIFLILLPFVYFLKFGYFNLSSNLDINFLVIYFTGLAGLIIFCVSILGVYLARIFKQVKNRPLYIIEKRRNI